MFVCKNFFGDVIVFFDDITRKNEKFIKYGLFSNCYCGCKFDDNLVLFSPFERLERVLSHMLQIFLSCYFFGPYETPKLTNFTKILYEIINDIITC